MIEQSQPSDVNGLENKQGITTGPSFVRSDAVRTCPRGQQ